ncbi:MAG TPA: hypothetical protein PK385_01595 [Spirochaetota bacterium]|nr:hypothetical protein [Spirochaetota bacterium]HOS32522.1 hypothetical protein [Spirochaetota bacterium]HOS54730.1 hypothetical protein [Spirochaetota bacterium]HPK61625.1 hypothetical protein [Spirochaetota bacterium]HQF76592.1 hypothetical protein [Spirochaetota bacterium]
MKKIVLLLAVSLLFTQLFGVKRDDKKNDAKLKIVASSKIDKKTSSKKSSVKTRSITFKYISFVPSSKIIEETKTKLDTRTRELLIRYKSGAKFKIEEGEVTLLSDESLSFKDYKKSGVKMERLKIGDKEILLEKGRVTVKSEAVANPAFAVKSSAEAGGYDLSMVFNKMLANAVRNADLGGANSGLIFPTGKLSYRFVANRGVVLKEKFVIYLK